MIRNVGTAKGL